MAISKKPYRGTRDFFPTEQRVQDYIFSWMKHAAESYGYEPYDGPLLEEVELYKAKSGEELINEQIYSFEDRGGRFVAIRPEMTPTLARMIAQVHREYPKPIRWYSIPNLMRYEKPQKGRLREHWQLNVDIFGAPESYGECEILQLAVSLFQSLGANESQFEILINDRTFVDFVFKDLMSCDQETAYRLYKIVDKAKKVPQEAIDKMLAEVGIDQRAENIFLEYLKLSSIQDVIDFSKKHENPDASIALVNLIEKTDSVGITKYLTFDPAIVRGLDYYTGIVFEIFDKHPDNRRALCGGGAYRDLLKIFGEEPVPGVGFGLGDVTLGNFLSIHNLLPDLSTPENDVFVTFQTEKAFNLSLNIASMMRQNGLNVISHPTVIAFNKAFKLAEKKGAEHVVLIGDTELEQNCFQLKNLKTKEQKTVHLKS